MFYGAFDSSFPVLDFVPISRPSGLYPAKNHFGLFLSWNSLNSSGAEPDPARFFSDFRNDFATGVP